MEELKNYLDSATVHGFAYIGQTRKLTKVFWILVVITGFSLAGILIHQSIASWEESPIKTTVETIPISEVTFPKVTICPPEKKFTNLNYDLKMSENISVSLFDHLMDIQYNFQKRTQEFDYEMTLTEINDNSFKEENGFRNWYLETRYTSKQIST